MTARDLPSPLPLTVAQVASFDRDGFLRIDALTNDAEIGVLLGLFDELFQRDGGFDAGDRIELNADVARAPLPQIVNPERYAPRLVQGLAYRNARVIARQLLGSDCVPTGNHAILKPVRIGGATPWHQDEAYWDPRYAHRAVSVWLALQAATLENGCMRFVPGSHRSGKLPQEALADANATHPEERLLTGRRGTVVVMNAHLWHGGTANRTDRPRLAMHSFYCRRDFPQQQYQKRLLRPDTQARLAPDLRWLLALDDPLNDEISANASGKSGFLK